MSNPNTINKLDLPKGPGHNFTSINMFKIPLPNESNTKRFNRDRASSMAEGTLQNNSPSLINSDQETSQLSKIEKSLNLCELVQSGKGTILNIGRNERTDQLNESMFNNKGTEKLTQQSCAKSVQPNRSRQALSFHKESPQPQNRFELNMTETQCKESELNLIPKESLQKTSQLQQMRKDGNIQQSHINKSAFSNTQFLFKSLSSTAVQEPASTLQSGLSGLKPLQKSGESLSLAQSSILSKQQRANEDGQQKPKLTQFQALGFKSISPFQNRPSFDSLLNRNKPIFPNKFKQFELNSFKPQSQNPTNHFIINSLKPQQDLSLSRHTSQNEQKHLSETKQDQKKENHYQSKPFYTKLAVGDNLVLEFDTQNQLKSLFQNTFELCHKLKQTQPSFMIAEVNQILNQVNILKGTLFENKSEIKYENDSNSSEPNMVSENVQMQSQDIEQSDSKLSQLENKRTSMSQAPESNSKKQSRKRKRKNKDIGRKFTPPPEAPKSIFQDEIMTDQESKFVCKTCGECFQHGQALGGHMSRTHPGQSTSFNRKLQRREERTFERKLLSLAKEMHQSEFGEHIPLNRVKIRRYKKELRKRYQTGLLKIDRSPSEIQQNSDDE